MKHRFFMAIIATVIIGAGVFYACTKEDANKSMPHASAIQKAKRPLTQEEKKTIAGYDACGAAAGAVAGSVGGGIGAAVGAVVGGIVSSVCMSRAIRNGDIVVSTAPNINDSPVGNDENPYDYVGKIHYLLMNDFLVNPELCCTDDSKFNTSIYYENIVVMLPNYMEGISTSMIASFGMANLTKSINMSSKPIATILSETVTGMTINPQLKNLLTAYEDYSKACIGFDVLYEYSVLKEADVLNATNFTDTEKQIALSYMATLRWGYWYWDNIEFED